MEQAIKLNLGLTEYAIEGKVIEMADELVEIRKAVGDVAVKLNDALTAVLGNIAITKMYLDSGRPKEAALKSLSDAEALFPKIADLTQCLLNLSDAGDGE